MKLSSQIKPISYLKAHAAADIQEDGQADGGLKVVLEIGDRLFDIVLIDREIFLLQVVDILPALVLDGDGDGDRADRDLVIQLRLFFLSEGRREDESQSRRTRETNAGSASSSC
jgi:hypothetical protein